MEEGGALCWEVRAENVSTCHRTPGKTGGRLVDAVDSTQK